MAMREVILTGVPMEAAAEQKEQSEEDNDKSCSTHGNFFPLL